MLDGTLKGQVDKRVKLPSNEKGRYLRNGVGPLYSLASSAAFLASRTEVNAKASSSLYLGSTVTGKYTDCGPQSGRSKSVA